MPPGSAFACRHCQSYTPEGRRGGHCQLLNVRVQGCWRACALGTLSFTPRPERLPQFTYWSADDIHPHLVEAVAHEAPNSRVLTSATMMREAIPAGLGRLREPLTDSSAA
ncbi:hypothetical protein OOK60_02025 [Trichothermofontia sichuanensis B231]|uniref:hypothetical protein n=1 Tax=Trichothermofontia sichuanensis TaxID=3045816 RepID=UPI002246F594|nr:hypothetical protein [Trichothermofontia sichuanensis]UZQ54887.1 hypothetical protein OOK60_02025 [Trichothermofontia sichuanensis B231]